MGVSKNRGTPNSHPKMIIFSRKTHGCWVPPFLETSIYNSIYYGFLGPLCLQLVVETSLPSVLVSSQPASTFSPRLKRWKNLVSWFHNFSTTFLGEQKQVVALWKQGSRLRVSVRCGWFWCLLGRERGDHGTTSWRLWMKQILVIFWRLESVVSIRYCMKSCNYEGLKLFAEGLLF